MLTTQMKASRHGAAFALIDTMVARQTMRSLVSGRLPGSETRGIAVVALFVAIQAADLVLTLTGLSRFGASIEANPVLAAAMQMCGAGVALLTAKTVAVALATLLNATRAYMTLALLTMLYVFGALVPWTWVLAL